MTIRKGDPISINMGRMHNHPNVWQSPEKFIPERFDMSSPWALTPSGKRRNTFAFSPFLGGQRICIGKTFIEVISKLTVPTFLSKFKFSFIDDSKRDSAPEILHNHMIVTRPPAITARISRR